MVGSRQIVALENQHRLEEACEPYGLIGHFPDDDVFVIPQEQLDLTPNLARELAASLNRSGHAPSVTDAGIELAVPAKSDDARTLASALSESLYALRHLHPERFLGRRFPGSHVPEAKEGLVLPLSARLMHRVVADDFMPDDKKPPVLDLFRSTGPYLASVDVEPLILFDAASQIASHAGGVNAAQALEALYSGAFKDFPINNDPTSKRAQETLDTLRTMLSDAAGPELNHVTLCNSGAEANEVALRIASLQRPGKKTIMSFEGAFHGRTMWALHSTWNPSKRLRFEMDDFKACWIPWPKWDGSEQIETGQSDVPAAYFQRLGSAARECPADADALEISEFETLSAVESALETGDIVAILLECMQSEGGDRWATERFFCRLRALALAYEVPFIVDEVQTGFHLGGPFFWHKNYQLPAAPDLVTSAKKCQVGAVISRWELEFPLEVHLTSAVRGLAQAAMVSEDGAARYQGLVEPSLKTLQEKFPELVLAPRAQGYSFAFDLPTPTHMQHFIKERIWRGYMVYGAGNRTLRFRMNTEMTPKSLKALFQRLTESLETLSAGIEPTWRNIALTDQAPTWPPACPVLKDDYRIVSVGPDAYSLVRDDLVAIENATYEPARQDDMDQFGELLKESGSLCLVALYGSGPLGDATVAGMAFAFPLRCFAHIEGPDDDPMRASGRVLYSADVCVHPDHRGHGLGGALKHAQVTAAMEARDEQGVRRYDFMTGRNRIGATDAMQSINSRYGAWSARRIEGQYRGEGAADYYRIPLCAPRLPHVPSGDSSAEVLSLNASVQQRIALKTDPKAPSFELRDLLSAGSLNGAIANKMSLCNFVTPGVSRAMEILRATAPKGLNHLVVSNGRSEMFDKGLRAFKFHRPKGRTVISVGPVHAGWTTAAARSITLATDAPENIFDWPTLIDATLEPEHLYQQLQETIDAHGAESILTVILEPLYEETGRLMPQSVLERIQTLCRQADVPLTLVENTTGLYRNGLAPWLSDAWSLEPDALFYFPGGQLGLSFLGDRYYVPDKLTLISTWDGDEVSLTRLAWELRVARTCDVAAQTAALQDAIRPLGTLDGLGLYQTVAVSDGPTKQRALSDAGIEVGLSGEGALVFAPALNISSSELSRLKKSIHDLI
jgi:RHH-type transcriptional regulator, proline utilization regulon repressor / proline dehydrogenase / delta 1-pyrroline-5-carboxylate dehydrogenase